MDTREKILPLSALDGVFSSGEWLIAVGRFDPLTAEQAARLKALRTSSRKLLALVLDLPDTLIAAAGRAALIAALRDVDAVTVAKPESWRAAIPNAHDVRIVEDSVAEENRSAEFVRYIVSRQTAASNGGSNL